MPKPVHEQEDVRALVNQAVHKERELTANSPDIIIKNKKEKTCILSFGYFPGVRMSCADVSEPSVRSIFKGLIKKVYMIQNTAKT
jgi:hypothetical protein